MGETDAVIERTGDPVTAGESWPPLPLEGWRATKETVHRYAQIVGKVRMALTPPRNHWWHVTLAVGARGVSTGPMPCAPGLAEVALDLVVHRAVVTTSAGATRGFALYDGLTVADFHDRLFVALDEVGVQCTILPTPFDLADGPPFPEDTGHRTYDADAVGRWWAVLRASHTVFSEFAGGFSARRARCSSSGTRSTWR